MLTLLGFCRALAQVGLAYAGLGRNYRAGTARSSECRLNTDTVSPTVGYTSKIVAIFSGIRHYISEITHLQYTFQPVRRLSGATNERARG